MIKGKFLVFLLSGILLPLTSCVYFQSTCKDLYSKAEKGEPYDAIIVPGVPFDSLEGNWSPVMKIRVYWSYVLYKKGIAKNVIYSGSSVYSPYVEAKIMAMYAEKLGIPKECIHTETNAEHSTENVYYSYYLGKRKGFRRMAVASDPFQSKMLASFARQQSLVLDVLPMVFDTVGTMPLESNIVIDPESAHVKDFCSIVKREKFWKRFMGTLGKNLKRDSADSKFLKRK